MNKNIFSPKGTLSSAWFLLYYVILLLLRVFGGAYLIINVMERALNGAVFIIPFLIIEILFVFNYKKRLMLTCRNLKLSVILAILLTFSIELVALLCLLIQDHSEQASVIVFYIGTVLCAVVQPIVVALLPVKR